MLAQQAVQKHPGLRGCRALAFVKPTQWDRLGNPERAKSVSLGRCQLRGCWVSPKLAGHRMAVGEPRALCG